MKIGHNSIEKSHYLCTFEGFLSQNEKWRQYRRILFHSVSTR